MGKVYITKLMITNCSKNVITEHCHQLTSNGQVSEEEPARDERLLSVTRGFLHDVQVWGVEAQGCGREAISHQVDPEQLNWNQSLGEAQRRSKKDATKERKSWKNAQTSINSVALLLTHQTTSPTLEEMR